MRTRATRTGISRLLDSPRFLGYLQEAGPWEKFAQEDPYTYILTSLKSQDQREFWQSGCQTAANELLPLMEAHRITAGVAMELGCGVGRLLFPLSSHFREVIGADIAEGEPCGTQIVTLVGRWTHLNGDGSNGWTAHLQSNGLRRSPVVL